MMILNLRLGGRELTKESEATEDLERMSLS